MTPNEIRAELTKRGLSLTTIAADADCTVPEISMCISGDRIYPQIREVIASKIGRSVSRVFGKHHPKPKRQSRWCSAA